MREQVIIAEHRFVSNSVVLRRQKEVCRSDALHVRLSTGTCFTRVTLIREVSAKKGEELYRIS